MHSYENIQQRQISLYVCCVKNDFFSKSFLVHVHILSFSLVPYSVRRKMSENTGNIRKPKRAGGRAKIKNNAEGLSEDLIIAKNLRTPENSSEEDAKSRDNRLQEIHRLQALRWYQYKAIIPCWELLFALKNPWSDVAALKPGWTRANRPCPPPDAHPSTLKTAADFQEIVNARAE